MGAVDPRLLVFLRQTWTKVFGRRHPVKILLFGSRARDDHEERSDYDFAFGFPRPDGDLWARFVSEVSEKAPTLKKLDLVNLNTCQAELRRRIQREGKLVYERKRTPKDRDL